MERKKNSVEKYTLIFLYVIFGVGIFGHLFNPLFDLMILLTPFTLFLTSFVLLINFFLNKEKQYLIWMISVYAVTFFIEVAGVKTGLIFGEYSYGQTLGFSVFDVPLIIGLNWTFIILGALQISRIISTNKYLTITLTAVLAVAFDFILEPVAIASDYWSWKDVSIPVQNYIAWFIIAAAAAASFEMVKEDSRNKLPMHYFFIQIVFFMILNLAKV